MEPRACGVCGTESTGPDARFCQSCGAGLDTVLLDLSEPHDVGEKRRGAGGRLQVLALAAVVVAVVGLLMLLPGGDTSADDQATDEGLQLPTGSGIVEARANAVEPATTQPTVQSITTSTMVAVGAVDVSALREMGATHLAVQTGVVLQVLDLHSGVWTQRVDLISRVSQMEPIGAGVVLTDTGSHVRYASVEGGDLLELSGPGEGWLLEVTEELVIIVQRLGNVVEAFYVDGSLAWTAEFPFSSWLSGLTPAGELVVQVNEWVELFDPIANETSVLATGTSVGMFGELVLVSTCTAELDCGIDQINTRTGRRDRIVNEAGWFGEADRDQINFFAQGTGKGTRFRLVDGILTATDEEPTLLEPERNDATDATTGITVTALRNGIQFVSPAGDLIAELLTPFPGWTPLVALIGNHSPG